jgi:ADP-ribose pyrophosphatase
MRKPIYSGRIVDLGLETVTLPNGVAVELEIIRHPGAAAVVPLHADGTVTLVRQYRHAGGGMHIEIPAGVLEAGEDPAQCAARELSEEVQLAAGRLTLLSAIHTTPGFTDERIHLYLGTALTPTDGQPDADEYLQPIRMPLTEAVARVRSGEITDGKTICGLLLAYLETTESG